MLSAPAGAVPLALPPAVRERPERVTGSIRLPALALALKVTGAVAREEVGGERLLRAQILRVYREATIACRRQRHDRQALVVAGGTYASFSPCFHPPPRLRGGRHRHS